MFCNAVSVCTCARILSLNTKTVRSLYKALRQCMTEDLLENGARTKIGGPGHIIEVDESKFGKHKYNRGRRVVGKWILGGYCRKTGDCFLVECPGNKRDHHTLLRLIKLHVAPGTIILTDKWKGYNQLSRHGYTHLTVNHRRGFVDPQTGVLTNTCEGMWFHAKKQMLRGHGRTRTDSSALEIALCEFMWRKKHDLNCSDSSVRKCFNRDIPQLMSRVFS
jgi:transposase-like protein